MSKSDISEQDKHGLKLIADLGFQYAGFLDAIPKEIQKKYPDYFNKKFSILGFSKSVKKLSAVSLAIQLGHSAEDRKKYLEKKKNENVSI